jgi:hypothetical protein
MGADRFHSNLNLKNLRALEKVRREDGSRGDERRGSAAVRDDRFILITILQR